MAVRTDACASARRCARVSVRVSASYASLSSDTIQILAQTLPKMACMSLFEWIKGAEAKRSHDFSFQSQHPARAPITHKLTVRPPPPKTFKI